LSDRYGADVCETLGPAAFKNSKCLHAIFPRLAVSPGDPEGASAPHAGGPMATAANDAEAAVEKAV
jgi:hypothetical protein